MSTQPINGEIVTEAAIVPQVHLGSIAIRNPKDMITQATELANALAEIITTQNLYKVINGRKYVFVEGWTTLGAMIGIVPVEEYCQPLPEGAGFEAKVKLIRASDGGTVGGASAECTRAESNWSDRDSYAVRSMSITRATGKAFRLSFSWIMKLAGYEPVPAEEIDGAESHSTGTAEAAQAVAAEKIAAAADTHKSVLCKELGNGMVSLAGDGLSKVLVALGDSGKAQLEMAWQGSPNGWVIPMKSSFAFEDVCKAQGVGFSYVATTPAKQAAPTKQAAPPATQQLGHGKITNVEPANGKKGVFMRVWQGSNKMQAFDNPQMRLQDGTTIALFTLLKTAKGQDAIFRVNKVGNYLNIVGVEKLGRFEWDEIGAPIIQVDKAAAK